VRYYEFVRVPSRLKLTIGQINRLRSFIKKTNDKREYCRAVAVFQKADGKTYDYKAREHKVHIRSSVPHNSIFHSNQLSSPYKAG
jgi:hypothetical protein